MVPFPMQTLIIRILLLTGFTLCSFGALAEHYTVPLFVTASTAGEPQGVLRILNGTSESGTVEIYAIDDAGTRSGPATFTLNASAAVQFTATDLASGNATLGLTGGIGTTVGDARLQIEADLAIVPLAFVRAADGTLSAMHDTVRGGSLSESGGYTYVVPVFNPASEVTQVSRLRLINPGDAAASITIGARDDSGAVATGGDATLTLAAGGAQTLTAQQLEAGDSSVTGRLGAGTGKWRLTVTSDRPLQVVNIVAASAGYWNNLSTTAIRGAAPTDHDAFTERFDGQNIVYATDAGTFALASMDNDRFSETGEVDGVTTTYTGNYSYSAIGPDAGRLTLDYDDADRCRADFYFSSYTAGWFASHCTGSGYPADGTWSGGSWSVEDDEDTLPGMGSQPGDRTQAGSLGECYVSLSVGIGESCTYPGTTDAFSVNARGRGSFLTSLAGIRVRIDNETIGGRVYDFEASHQGDGVWRIDRIAGSTEAPETPPMTGGGGMVDGDDDDNDGVSNADDAFPQDPDESVDTDGDGVGNNADTDDDDDGVADADDACPLDSDAACGQVSGPDLVVQSASVSDSTLKEGESFTFGATVRNQGAGQAVATTLRYYRSMDATIATGDTEVGTDAVSALAASSTGDESISLTAPSTAGTYYYGACLDPVSGESDSQNNCSTAVRVTVGASQMEIEGFDLNAGDIRPEGITFANDRFYVVDHPDDKVYAYQSSGQRDSASDFDLDPDNSLPRGITFANDRFYVADNGDDKVYAYHASGERDSASDFELDSANEHPTGITFANDKLYVVDGAFFGGRKKVFAYQSSGQRDSAFDFVLAADSDRPAGITFANDRFYVVDWRADNDVYAYDALGRRVSAPDLHLDADNSAPRGITFANGGFYVVDFVDDRVYAYDSEHDTSSVFVLAADSDHPDGITFANGNFYVVDWGDDKVYAYQSSGQRDSASDFDLDPDDLDRRNENAAGITFANNKFYVVNVTPSPSEIDNVYAYDASGQGDTASDFDLDADNTDPEGITFANDKFYVVDQTDDKVYAYDASGQRESDSDFDLDSDNGDATGIAFANDRFYVADIGDDFVYAYDASGRRESAHDHFLDPDNGDALGITFANGSVYVVDRYTGVYVLNFTGPSPDLEIPTASVSPSTPLTGQSFELRATVRNRGTGTSTATTLRYYRSFGYTISASDTQLGMDAVGALSPRTSGDQKTITLTAPEAAGTYYYGACVESIPGEPYTDNNCSSAVRLTVGVRRPDLVVESPSVSDDTPGSEGSFVLTASVRNRGTTASTATTLRYYRSDDRRISTDDTEVGTGTVSAVAVDGASSQTITLTAPSTDGTYYYGACVDQAAEELRAYNNCSTGVAVFVGGPYPAYDLAISAARLSSATFVGQSVYMTVTVVNRGPNRSQPAKLRFGSSTYRDIPALDPDETTTPERAFAGTARSGGTVSAEACIVEAPGEEDTSNNCRGLSASYR